MVRTMPSNPWRCADFLERVRPGFAVSVALHIGLFLVLAYWLAFRPVIEMPPADDPVFTVVQPPRAVLPPPVVVKTTVDVKPIKPQTIDKVRIGAPPPLWLPPNDDADEGAQTSTVLPRPGRRCSKIPCRSIAGPWSIRIAPPRRAGKAMSISTSSSSRTARWASRMSWRNCLRATASPPPR